MVKSWSRYKKTRESTRSMPTVPSCFISATPIPPLEYLVEAMPKQNKSVLQKQYRNKELDGFSLVRKEIRHATGGELDPKTRQDVLRKAARLIRELSVLNTKLQHQLYNAPHTRGSEIPPSYVGGVPTTLSSPCTEGPYSPVLYEYFIEQPNNSCQLAGIPPSEFYSCIIGQVNPHWSPGRQYYNHSEHI
ncbi:hypothetical protein DFJ58DRAFT_799785 [Suillus subalutaceus]|uniref:uncharacterized protein n=1 Tax=Suillus subalutaceus TaxID=48586 RepID=UPI001B862779|nr:uncharacterized protein DFJ58DRAFT_799785 [Suillus subalutaceus]KAG1846084.1 hypothetical protein DFJ58DRAFT_799785 [Suillus subalutaceus]